MSEEDYERSKDSVGMRRVSSSNRGRVACPWRFGGQALRRGGWPPTITEVKDCDRISDPRPLSGDELKYRDETFGAQWN